MAQLSHARQEPMFRDFSLNRAENATDFAIPLLADGGWPAMTLASVAARGNMKRQSDQGDRPEAATVARMLLPSDDDGIAFARIWLAICEAGRSDLGIAAATTYGESEQLAMVASRLPVSSEPDVRAVCALVTGLRAQLCAPEPITLADAWSATEVLRR